MDKIKSKFKFSKTKEMKITVPHTWVSVFPLFKQWILSGEESQKLYVIEELERLCKLADEVNNGTN